MDCNLGQVVLKLFYQMIKEDISAFDVFCCLLFWKRFKNEDNTCILEASLMLPCRKSGPEVIKLFSSSVQLSMNFQLLINA